MWIMQARSRASKSGTSQWITVGASRDGEVPVERRTDLGEGGDGKPLSAEGRGPPILLEVLHEATEADHEIAAAMCEAEAA
jgi:hypothetical protein